ncbi:hypothetical protein LguiA_015931 [Lonicera macranthoides]
MAAMALQRRVNNNTKAIRNPSGFLRLFSSSSSSTSDPNIEDQNQNTTHSSSSSPSPSRSSYTSYFSDVKASLKQQQSPLKQRQPLRGPISTPPSAPFKVSSLQEIRKKLSEFPLRSTVPPAAGDKSSSSHPPSSSSSSSQYISFSEHYRRKVISKGEEREPSNELNKGGRPTFEAIRETIKQMNQTKTNGGGAMSLARVRESFNLRPLDPNQKESPMVTGGGRENLPLPVFRKEMMSNNNKSVEAPSTGLLFMKNYSKEKLGSKLRRLRPEAAKGDNNNNWFSLRELNDRLMKLNEIEMKESESINIGGGVYGFLRDSLQVLQISSDQDKAKESVIQRLDLLNQIRGTPNFMTATPKENLVEKYFHPDNMSSSEKMKLELKKVRDEFKMSESDCGSSRVQVALLTTKIKHLSTTLHKKDKHSRKGLQAMVQKRKKLLKYLRRTDWDSYCLVLSKLGLRDNPDYKN